MATALIRPHVLSDRDQIELVLPEGKSLQDIAELVWPEEALDCVVLTVNGDAVPSRYWKQVRPKEGAMVRGFLTFGKKKGGKSTLGLVAMIAVAIFAPYAAAAMGFTGLAATAVAMGISLVGNLLVSALFKPSGMNPGSSGSTDPAESKTYSITSQSNQATPYSPIPRVYGVHKVFPRVAASPFTVNEANEQYLYMLLDFGFGPLDVESLMIGETPLLQYLNVDYRIHPEFVAGDPLELYTNDIFTESLGTELKYNVPVLRTTKSETTSVGIDLQFPRGLVVYNKENGNRQSAGVGFNIELREEGSPTWKGYGAYQFRFASQFVNTSNTPTTAVVAEVKIGTQSAVARDITPFEGPDPTFRRRSVYGVKAGDTTLNLAGGARVPAIGAQLAFPDGRKYTVQSVSGSVVTISPALAVNYGFGSSAGSTLTLGILDSTGNPYMSVTAASSEPVYVTLNVIVPEGKYEVRVTRTSADDTATNVSTQSVWTALRSQASRPPIAPEVPHTIMELRIRASEQLSGVVQTLSGICTAILPAWNGSAWVAAQTGNPASAFLDVLRGTANRRPVPDSSIDFESLQAWYNACATLNQSGQPSFELCHVVDYSTTKYQLLNSIASAGRATLSWRDGKIGVIMDKEQNVPAQLFTPRNSWGLSSNRSYLETPHAFRVAFVDPALDWGEGQVMVYADGYNETNATKFEDYKTFGIITAEQAWRDGRYMLAQGLLRREEFSLETDIENLACIRGDLVLVQHDVLRVGGDSSRIVSVASTTQFTQFDPLPTIDPGIALGVRIRKSSNGQLVGPIRAYANPPYSWTLSSPITGLQEGDLLAWGELVHETGEYLVKNIAPGQDFTATLTLCEMARAIYSADTGPIPPYSPPQSGRPADTLPQPPLNVRVTQLNKTIARRPGADLILEWNLPTVGAYRRFNVYALNKDGMTISLGTTTGKSFTLVADIDIMTSPYNEQVFQFGVEAIDFVGAASDIVWVSENLSNPRWVPDALDFLSSNVQGENTVLTWRLPIPNANMGNSQVVGFDLRWSPDPNATFSTATRIADLIAWPASTITVPTRNGAYLIKPYTSSGVYSRDARRTVIHTEDLIRINYYAQPRFAPSWSGTFIDTEIYGGELRLKRNPDSSLPSVGYFISSHVERYNQTIISQLAAFLIAYGVDAGDVLSGPRFTPLSNAVPLATQHAAEDYDVKLWISAVNPALTPDDPIAEARPIINAQIEASSIWFILELRTLDGETTPSVVQAGADIDFPERTETHPDYPIAVGGTRLIFDYPFIMPPTVAITLQNAQPSQYVWRSQADQYGVDIAIVEGDVQAYFSNGFSNGFYKTPNITRTGVVDILVNGPGRAIP
jgi:hypothetical protein